MKMESDTVSFNPSTVKRRSHTRNPLKIRIISMKQRSQNGNPDIYLCSNTFLSSFLNFGSTLLLIPFNILVENEEDPSFKVRFLPKRKLARIACFLIHFSQQGFLLYFIIDALKQTSLRVEAWAVLALLFNVFEMTLHAIAWYTFTFQQRDLQVLVNKLEGNRNSHRKSSRQTQSQWSLVNICQGADAVIYWTFAALFITGMLSSFRRNMAWSIATFIFPNEFSGLMTWIAYLLATTVFILERLGCAVELFMLAGVLSMFEVGQEFEERVDRITTPSQLMEAHKDIQNIFSSFNRVFGRLFMNHYICTLFTYVGTPAMLTKMSVGVDKISYRLVYIGIHALIYFSSCEVHSIVKTCVCEWIYGSKMRTDLQPLDMVKLSILGTEVENKPIGIACSKFFVISYGLMGSFLGVLATYAIFAWQMQAHGMA